MPESPTLALPFAKLLALYEFNWHKRIIKRRSFQFIAIYQIIYLFPMKRKGRAKDIMCRDVKIYLSPVSFIIVCRIIPQASHGGHSIAAVSVRPPSVSSITRSCRGGKKKKEETRGWKIDVAHDRSSSTRHRRRFSSRSFRALGPEARKKKGREPHPPQSEDRSTPSTRPRPRC